MIGLREILFSLISAIFFSATVIVGCIIELQFLSFWTKPVGKFQTVFRSCQASVVTQKSFIIDARLGS